MNKEQIRAAIGRGAPFTLQLADGRSFEIQHEDYIAVPPSGSSVFVFEDSGYYHVLSLRLIANLTGQTTFQIPLVDTRSGQNVVRAALAVTSE